MKVNGRAPAKGLIVTAADIIEVKQPAAARLLPNPSLPLEILYTSAALIIANKPAPQPCYPLRGDERDTLMNAVIARFPEAAGNERKPLEGLLVHRLDNGTSGAIMIARAAPAMADLRSALRSGEIERCYLALVAGTVEEEIVLNFPIAHHPRNARKMIAVSGQPAPVHQARAAVTVARPLRRVGRFTLLALTPKSGSRHQIRVHLAAAGYPIAGDTLYGGEQIAALASGRFFLHLAELKLPRSLAEPDAAASGKEPAVTIKAPLPNDLRATLAIASRPQAG